jgi:DnaJ-class molecular chaperone
VRDIDRVNSEPCRCVTCGECDGRGTFRAEVNLSDFDLEPCDGCGGSGIVETCDRCQLLDEMEFELP